MAKAVDAFRTISEVADELNVPKHVLRFWEGKFPQLRPMKRGGGRRLYRPEDVDLLTGIRHLLYEEGYTIKGVQKVMREQGLDWVKGQTSRSAAPAGERKSRAISILRKRGGGATAVLSAEQRRELQTVLAELESLKRLLGSTAS